MLLGIRKAVLLGPPPARNRREHPFVATADFQGIPIRIETRAGDERKGTAPDGVPWSVTFAHHYGEIPGTLGLDGEPVDVFLGPDETATTAYVVHQKHPKTQAIDEDKVFLCWSTAAEAERAYRAHYTSTGFFDGITSWPIAELRDWLADPANRGKRLDRPAWVRAKIGRREGQRAVMRKAVADPAGQLRVFGPPDEWNGGIASILGEAGRHALTAAWEAMGEEERAQVRAEFARAMRKGGGGETTISAHERRGPHGEVEQVRQHQRVVRPGDVRPGASFPIDHHYERVHVNRVADGQAEIAYHRPDGPKQRVPVEHVPHLVHDLNGTLAHHTPTSGNEHVDAVIRGEGRHLGKGNDGIVWTAPGGKRVVKASTTVPFQPMNGARTPEQAAAHLQNEAEAHEVHKEDPLVPQVQAVSHEGRTFLVKPFLHPTGKLSREDLDKVRDSVQGMHARGWTINDQIQLGRDAEGNLKHMDLGSSTRGASEWDRRGDIDHLERLYKEHGEQYTPGGEELRRQHDEAHDKMDTLLARAKARGWGQDHPIPRLQRDHWKRLHHARSIELLGAAERHLNAGGGGKGQIRVARLAGKKPGEDEAMRAWHEHEDRGDALETAWKALPERGMAKGTRLFLRKSQLGLFTQQVHVKAHARRTHTGKFVEVHEHVATRPKAPEQPSLLDFRRPESPQVEPEAKRAPEQERAGGGRTHVDVGEKIGAARKDTWAGRHATAADLEAMEAGGEAVKHVTKAAFLAMPDPAEERANGTTPGGYQLKKALLDSIGTMPADTPSAPGSSPVGRIRFVRALDAVQRDLDRCKTVDDVLELLEDWRLLRRGGYVRAERLGLDEAVRRFHPEHLTGGAGGKGSGFRLGDYWFAPDEFRRQGFEEARPMGSAVLLYRRATAEEAEAHGVPSAEDRRDSWLRTTWGIHVEVLGNRFKAIVRGFGRNTVPTFHSKETRTARRREVEDDWNGLIKGTKKERRKPQPMTGGREQEVRRVGGPQVPLGTNGDYLLETFGLRGVEHGNWVNDEERAAHIKAAAEALHDLADLLGVEPKALAHEGRLGLAIGARGTGRALAHYESGKVVINLTKTSGSGSLAHEFGHFLDHAVTFQPGEQVGDNRQPALTGDPKIDADAFAGLSTGHRSHLVNPEVADAMAAVMGAIRLGFHDPEHARLARVAEHAVRERKRAWDEGRRAESAARLAGRRFSYGDPEHTRHQSRINETGQAETSARRAVADHLRAKGIRPGTTSGYYTDAQKLGSYWKRDHELFARAFETWAASRLEAKGRANTYLTTDHKTRSEPVRRIRRGVEEYLHVYPQGQEAEAIWSAIDHLVDTVRRTGALRKALALLGRRRLVVLTRGVRA